MNNKYLPSKQFISRIIILALIAGVGFGLYELTLFIRHKLSPQSSKDLLIESLVQKDSNRNDIADWEESLWGLDPKGNGQKNKEFIIAKRKELAESQGISFDETANHPLTENETMAREFFASIMALQEADSLTPEALRAISDQIGQRIEAAPLDDIYTKDMQKTTPQTQQNDKIFFLAIKKLFEKYEKKSIGEELIFINQGIQNFDKSALSVAAGVGVSYENFGKELMSIPVPPNYAQTMLSLANNYDKTGRSVEGMAKLIDDPLIAMRALINYKIYSDALVVDIETLSNM